LVNKHATEPQSAKVEVEVEAKAKPATVDEFDDDDAIEALVAAEAECPSSDPA
jgi:uracil-DNA glycosylase